MIIFITIASIIAMYKCVKKSCKFSFNTDDKVFSVFIGAICGILLTMVISLPAVIWGDTSTGYQESHKIPIASVQTGDTIHGRFVLGSGYIGSSQVYYSMIRLGPNSFKPDKTYVNDVISIDEVDTDPCIVVYKNETRNKWLHYITLLPELQYTSEMYKFIVPKGTIIQEFRVN